MVDLLHRLRDRFEQVILITHIEYVREGLDRVVTVRYDEDRGLRSSSSRTIGCRSGCPPDAAPVGGSADAVTSSTACRARRGRARIAKGDG